MNLTEPTLTPPMAPPTVDMAQIFAAHAERAARNEALRPSNKPIAPRLAPRRCSAKITPRSSLLRCLLRLSIATSYAQRAMSVALET